MREPISLREILAVLIRKGTFLLVLALIAGILVGGCKFVQLQVDAGNPENTPERIEARYQAAIDAWQTQKADLEKQLGKAEMKLAQQEHYCENSLLMEMNPYDTYKCVLVYAITGLEILPEEGTDSSEDRASRMVAKIQDQYMLYWDSADLKTELAKHGYPEIEDKYHRETVRIEISGGGTLSVVSIGKDAETATKLAETVYACMQTVRPRVEAGAYPHSLTLMHSSIKSVVSGNLEDRQENAKKLLHTCTAEVESLQQQVEDLQQPQKEAGYGLGAILSASAKWFALGGAVGLFLGCVWLLLMLLVRSKAESSRQMEKLLQLPFLGSLAKRGDMFNRVACAMLGERCWKDSQQAADYVTENLKALPGEGSAVVILTSLPERKLGQSLETVKAAAAGAFETVYVVADAEYNPQTAKMLSLCSRVLLAERVGVSQTQGMLALIDTAKRLNAKVEGFIVM